MDLQSSGRESSNALISTGKEDLFLKKNPKNKQNM